METNHKKGKNRKAHHSKKHRKPDDSKSLVPKPPNKEGKDEKPVLFQLGSIASYKVNDVRFQTDPEISTSTSATLSLSSFSPSSSGDILDLNAKERKSDISLDSSQQNQELFSISSKMLKLQGSSDTLGSQVSGLTHAASMEPALLSPSVQMMDREGSDQPQRNSLSTLERNLSTASNDSLFSLSIGDNAITRDELFDYRDFKSGDPLISGELLSFCPSLHIPAESSDLGKSFDMVETVSGDIEVRTFRSDSEDKSSNSNVSWRNLGDCNNSDESPSSTQSFSYPITKKKKKKKKKGAKKKTTQPQQQQQQKQKKRCSWLCCKNTGPCFAWCKCLSCNYNFSCCKRPKCCSCSCKRTKCGSCLSCCRWPKCGSCFSCCRWPKCGSCFSCCRWPKCGSCFSCCRWPKCGSCSCCRWPKCSSCFSCCRWPKCGSCFSCCKWPSCHHSSCCSWLFCCHWGCWSCCSSCSKKVVDDEMSRGNEEQKMKKAESKTSRKWFCCFPYCSS